MTERKTWSSTSPSQISTFRDCARKWYRESVLGERPPSSPAAERGTRVHEQIEQWLMNGIAPTDGTARAMLRHLPPGGSVSPDHVEQSFDITPPGWVARVRGRIDLIDPTTNQIIDHKTTATLDYAKSEQDLATDTQAIIYSAVALSGALGVEFGEPLRFALSYGTTRGAVKTALVSRTFTRAQLSEPLARIGEEVAQQRDTAGALQWSEVEPNYQSCDKYGGCFFRDDCTQAQRALIQVAEPSQAQVSSFMSALRGEASSKVIIIEDRPALKIDDELDLRGAAYEQTNPPDGLPDREPLPENQQPARRLPRFRWNDKSLSQMKAPELIEAIQELTAIMSSQTRATYESQTAHLTRDTMSANRERLEILHKITYGITDTPKAPTTMSQDDFFAAFNASVQEQVQEKVQEEVQEQVQEEVQEEVQEVQDIFSAHRQKAWIQAGIDDAEATAEEDMEPTSQYRTPSTILCVDALCSIGESADLLTELAPWIADIERRHGAPICMIQYDEGWKQLGARLASQKVWLFSKNIVTIESSHPLYRHCSHVLSALADITIKGTR